MPEPRDVPALTDAQQAAWRAAISDVMELSARLRRGTATDDDMHGALNRLLACDIDRDLLRNVLHIPPDAGPYAAALERILRRIPDGWGRWFSHDTGWYQIVVSCDERLAAVDAEYVVHRVKEKFGTLRYYCAPSADPSADVWNSIRDITGDAERLSAVTCERCSEPGLLHTTKYLVKTLCDACAAALGYPPIIRSSDDSDMLSIHSATVRREELCSIGSASAKRDRSDRRRQY